MYPYFDKDSAPATDMVEERAKSETIRTVNPVHHNIIMPSQSQPKPETAGLRAQARSENFFESGTEEPRAPSRPAVLLGLCSAHLTVVCLIFALLSLSDNGNRPDSIWLYYIANVLIAAQCLLIPIAVVFGASDIRWLILEICAFFALEFIVTDTLISVKLLGGHSPDELQRIRDFSPTMSFLRWLVRAAGWVIRSIKQYPRPT
ncbi:hypothetical protein TWF225_001723 [Orbilia oligospora]|nr:hypothetical protein TWF225_001723 [Orbilia oligospora]KAF3172161.1 hypothetical protein TWF751_005824 [Orbilia oligospora]KAF3239484.1 hypothetical protein TWF217_001282 [Orbilia oligospora]KAF3243948.1 hypothetical protein TWF128_009883 [Orbilia oligospora]KAF3287976.1 hypothetical protein TWF132_008097 [Orbilia oligospora]